jgi:hypothetical protein
VFSRNAWITRLTVFRQFAQVTLMKYLYKAMESLGSDPNTQASGNVVLGWHEKVRFPSLFPLSFLSPSMPPAAEPLPLARSSVERRRTVHLGSIRQARGCKIRSRRVGKQSTSTYPPFPFNSSPKRPALGASSRCSVTVDESERDLGGRGCRCVQSCGDEGE